MDKEILLRARRDAEQHRTHTRRAAADAKRYSDDEEFPGFLITLPETLQETPLPPLQAGRAPLPSKVRTRTSSAPPSSISRRKPHGLEVQVTPSNSELGQSDASLVWSPHMTTLKDRKRGLEISATSGLRLGEWRYKMTAPNIELHHNHQLGSGNFGHVVLATNKVTGEKIAVKILKSSDKPSDRSMLNELKSFVKADGCSYLVQFFGGFLLDGKVHIGLELVDLGSLEQLQRRVEEASRRIPAEFIACITRQMVYGLNYLHDRSRLHRDIKPGNVLHNSHGQVKLTDFGISVSYGTGENSAHVNEGTKKYAAPDVSWSMVSDVWSLGMVVCELSMMRYPYDVIDAAVEVIISEEPEPRLSEDHPVALRNFIELTLKKLPGRALTEPLKGHTFLWTPRSDRMDFSCWLQSFPAWSEKWADWQIEPVHRERSHESLALEVDDE